MHNNLVSMSRLPAPLSPRSSILTRIYALQWVLFGESQLMSLGVIVVEVDLSLIYSFVLETI